MSTDDTAVYVTRILFSEVLISVLVVSIVSLGMGASEILESTSASSQNVCR